MRYTISGLMTFGDGYRYAGQWVFGNMHGLGVLAFSDGEDYRGAYRDNLRHGRGVDIYGNGDMYEGDYEFGFRHGTVLEAVCRKTARRLWLHGTAHAFPPFRLRFPLRNPF